MEMPENLSRIESLLQIMAQLRNPDGGCPWDLEQNFASIAPYTIEEAYEVADAIELGDMDELRDELGDLLLQVVFHAQMAKEAAGKKSKPKKKPLKENRKVRTCSTMCRWPYPPSPAP